ncbi:solute carrier family 22 member 7-like isoform X2 [Sardina pilchardus]|uniref:solute carrier family 22 member 7-like isoform X2 n=1 Tax=Sardina pilchardus TaxID=27697 RepID=UPI002E148202
MKFENILAETDGFGRFQIALIVLLVVPRITLPCHFLLNNFIAATPSHHCDFSGLDTEGVFENLTAEQRLAVSLPTRADGTPSSCLMFPEPQFHLLLNSSNTTTLPAGPCQNGWVFDNSTFKSTLATQFDLVCDKRRLTKGTATIFFIGVMLGAVFFGVLCDKYGRRSMLLVSYISAIVFSLISALSNSYIMFAVFRFLTGFGITGISIITIVLNRWIPESARWLIAAGKPEKAHYFLQRCATINRREEFSTRIKPETLSSIISVDQQKRSFTYLDLIKTPRMRRLTVFTGIVWYGVASTYYGISLNITGFGLDLYLTHFIYAAIELPAKFLTYFSLNVIGRRYSQMGTLLATGICILINILTPKSFWMFRTIVAVLGKGLSEAAFTTVFLYTTELYPTVVRQNGVGYTSFMARLGASVSPLIMLLEDVWKPFPEVVFCSVAIFSGLVAWLLPETLNARLPETIEDIEQTRKRSICLSSQDQVKLKPEPEPLKPEENMEKSTMMES